MKLQFPEYWNWSIYHWWTYRQYKRADRVAFRKECANIRWHAAWVTPSQSQTLQD
jgi:hypothetical protein